MEIKNKYENNVLGTSMHKIIEENNKIKTIAEYSSALTASGLREQFIGEVEFTNKEEWDKGLTPNLKGRVSLKRLVEYEQEFKTKWILKTDYIKPEDDYIEYRGGKTVNLILLKNKEDDKINPAVFLYYRKKLLNYPDQACYTGQRHILLPSEKLMEEIFKPIDHKLMELMWEKIGD